MSRTAFERLRSNERFEALRLETLRLQQEARERAARGPCVTSNTAGLSEYEPHKFSVEASGIGLRPGEWPCTLETTLGNGIVFVAQRREVRDGDLLWVDYLQGNGCVWLRVYND